MIYGGGNSPHSWHQDGFIEYGGGVKAELRRAKRVVATIGNTILKSMAISVPGGAQAIEQARLADLAAEDGRLAQVTTAEPHAMVTIDEWRLNPGGPPELPFNG